MSRASWLVLYKMIMGIGLTGSNAWALAEEGEDQGSAIECYRLPASRE